MKRCFLMLLFTVLLHLYYNASCQDIAFSQYYDQPLLRNPALAGVFTGDLRLVASYRNQWQSVTVPYRTFGVSAEAKFPVGFITDDYLTLGLQVIKDVAGTSEFSTTQILPAANYSFPLLAEQNSYLSLAFMGGMMQQRFDQTKLVLNDQFINNSNGSFTLLPASRQVFNKTDISYFDLSFGLSYNGSAGDDIDYFVGAGWFHVTKPKVAFFDGKEVAVNRKYTYNFGLSVPASEIDRVIFYADYFTQGKVNIFQGGIMVSHDIFVLEDLHKTITGGVLYRRQDAVIPVIQLELNKFTIGTSYDINVSKLSVASQYRGGFELTLSYKDWFNSRRANNREIKCPKFGGFQPGGNYIGY